MIKNKKYRTNKNRSSGLRKRALLAIALCVVIGLGYVGFSQLHQTKNLQTKDGTTVNLDPATETEKQEADQHKDDIAKDEQTPPPSTPDPSSGKKSVTPVISEASRSTVRAYVSGVFEEDGTCLATFTKDAKTLTKTSKGFQNASYTQCAPITLDSGFLASGKWAVTITYSSSTAEGTSTISYIE